VDFGDKFSSSPFWQGVKSFSSERGKIMGKQKKVVRCKVTSLTVKDIPQGERERKQRVKRDVFIQKKSWKK
jgi:hypothetical protein